jgi:hypothetical protein
MKLRASMVRRLAAKALRAISSLGRFVQHAACMQKILDGDSGLASKPRLRVRQARMGTESVLISNQGSPFFNSGGSEAMYSGDIRTLFFVRIIQRPMMRNMQNRA